MIIRCFKLFNEYHNRTLITSFNTKTTFLFQNFLTRYIPTKEIGTCIDDCTPPIHTSPKYAKGARTYTRTLSLQSPKTRKRKEGNTLGQRARAACAPLFLSLSPPRMFSVSHYHGPSQRLARTPGILISPVSPNLLTYLTCRAARYPATATAVRLLHTLQRGVYEDDSISAPVKSAGRFFRKGREVQGSFDN